MSTALVTVASSLDQYLASRRGGASSSTVLVTVAPPLDGRLTFGRGGAS